MSQEKKGLPYEEAAHVVTVTGWACKTCRQWWGNGDRSEHMARWCCASSVPCPCGGRNLSKSYTICEACRDRKEEEEWQSALQGAVPWNGDVPLCTWRGDTYFFSPDDIEDYIDREVDVTLEGLRLCLCEPGKAREFNLGEFLSDDLPDDYHEGQKFGEIDEVVNAFIAAGPYGDGGPWGWYGSDVPVSMESLRQWVREPEERKATE